MSDRITPTRDSLHTVAVVLGSLVVLLPMLLGGLLEAALDSVNTAGVDITQDLAYLRELLFFSFGMMAVLVVVVVALCVVMARRDRSTTRIRLPLIVLGLNLAVGIGLLVVNSLNTSIEAGYIPS
ncbi:MAG: hypothetical protein ACOH1J_06270 [Microbacteriaceae bacterium]